MYSTTGAEFEYIFAAEINFKKHIAEMNAVWRGVPDACGNIEFELMLAECLFECCGIEIAAVPIARAF